MISEILIPKSILDEIRQDAIKQLEKDREAVGIVLGTYDNDVATGSERYSLGSKIGNGTLKAKILDRINSYLHYRFLNQQRSRLIDHATKLVVDDRKNVSFVTYHSHTCSSWSPKDLESIENHQEPNEYVKGTAHMLYTVNTDKFIALNEKCQSIPITDF
jgi:proteasome lid subunit RPN8/RPN11